MTNKIDQEQEVTIDGKKVTIYVIKPSNENISNADMYRAKIWNKCIRDGIITKKELRSLMEERGIWNRSKSDEEDKIGKKISDLEKSLFRGKDGKKKPKVSEGKKIAVEMKDLRQSLRDLIQERLALEENTAEALSDNARFDYFVAHCTFFKDSEERVYNSVEDYSSKSSDEIAFAAASMLGNILYNLDSDFEKNLPENKWLRMFELTNDKGSFIDQEGQMVDSSGHSINDLGHYLDAEGGRVDVDGDPLDDNGNYLLVEYENDLAKPKKKTRAKKKTPVKTEVTES